MKDLMGAVSSVQWCKGVVQLCVELGVSAKQQPEKMVGLVQTLHSSMLALEPFLQEIAITMQDSPAAGSDAHKASIARTQLLGEVVGAYGRLEPVLEKWRQHFELEVTNHSGPGHSGMPHKELFLAVASVFMLLTQQLGRVISLQTQLLQKKKQSSPCSKPCSKPSSKPSPKRSSKRSRKNVWGCGSYKGAS
ncbi:hypothetical protein OEZ85_000268 [Tetradesmus obliquus]|uniref:Uncharacterized protein n=1 Tax=Tetradesmus obliquus TaxID=3088 RepID=A0ABY8UPQ5_TETOB|nr:hypothetical protein OEZ85_000268 [Tetradesmus obliquus]